MSGGIAASNDSIPERAIPVAEKTGHEHAAIRVRLRI